MDTAPRTALSLTLVFTSFEIPLYKCILFLANENVTENVTKTHVFLDHFNLHLPAVHAGLHFCNF